MYKHHDVQHDEYCMRHGCSQMTEYDGTRPGPTKVSSMYVSKLTWMSKLGMELPVSEGKRKSNADEIPRVRSAPSLLTTSATTFDICPWLLR